MKFLHLADLHIGKKLNDYSLFEDQRFVFEQAIKLAKEEDVDAIIIAGDVYDSSAPSAEAMDFYDWFLNKLYQLKRPVIMISGNHDSSERLNVASSILKENNIYIVTKLSEDLSPITLGDVAFYPLPYFRPADVNRVYGSEARSYESAMKEVLSRIVLDPSKANVLITHQAILPLGLSIEASGSETSLDIDAGGSVGESEAIDVSLFGQFDYLALGHIHKAQNIARNARYPGALLKYHVKEANAKRSFTIVDIQGKEATIKEFPIELRRDLVILTGTLEELLSMEGHENDYVQARLLDEQIVDSPFAKLKAKYPYCLGLEYPRINAKHDEAIEYEHVEEMDKTELFSHFYESYGGRELDEAETSLVKSLFDKEVSQ